MKKKILGVALLGFAVAALAGCNKTDDGSIILLNFKPEIQDKWGEIQQAVKDELGFELKVSTAASGQYESTLRSTISTDKSPAIFQISGLVGYKNWEKYVSDLDGAEVTKALLNDSLALKVDGKTKAIPVTEEGYGIIYNKAIADRYFKLEGHVANVNSMDDVKSYETLKAVVEDMQAKKEQLGIEGVFCPSGLGSDDSWRITGHTFNMALIQEFGLMTSMPDEIQFSGATQYRNLIDLYVKNSTVSNTAMVDTTQTDSFKYFQDGKTLMVQNGQWATSGLTGKGAKAEDLRFLPLYCGLTNEAYPENKQGICIGTEAYWCVNSKLSEKKQENAKKFLNWLFNGNGEKYVVGELGFNAPFKDFASKAELAQTDPLVKEVTAWMAKKDVTNLPWNFAFVPDTDNQRTDLVNSLKKYYNDNYSDATWNALVESAKTTWKKLAAATK